MRITPTRRETDAASCRCGCHWWVTSPTLRMGTSLPISIRGVEGPYCEACLRELEMPFTTWVQGL